MRRCSTESRFSERQDSKKSLSQSLGEDQRFLSSTCPKRYMDMVHCRQLRRISIQAVVPPSRVCVAPPQKVALASDKTPRNSTERPQTDRGKIPKRPAVLSRASHVLAGAKWIKKLARAQPKQFGHQYSRGHCWERAFSSRCIIFAE